MPEELPIVVDDSLRIGTVGGSMVQLTTMQAFALCDDLVRRAMRRAMVEESFGVIARRGAGAARSNLRAAAKSAHKVASK